MEQSIKIGDLSLANLSEDKENELLAVLQKRIEDRKLSNSDYVIIRSAHAGVFFGTVKEVALGKGIVVLNNCRRLFYWTGGASLSQLAKEGSDKAENKFTVRTDNHIILGVIEFIPCTAEAARKINSVKEWKV